LSVLSICFENRRTSNWFWHSAPDAAVDASEAACQVESALGY
jgi:hypothetical protein